MCRNLLLSPNFNWWVLVYSTLMSEKGSNHRSDILFTSITFYHCYCDLPFLCYLAKMTVPISQPIEFGFLFPTFDSCF